MLSDIITLGLSVLGIIFLLILFISRLLVWQSDNITVVLPLSSPSVNIYSKVYRVYSLFDFLGIHKKCTVVIINYGAGDWFLEKIQENYGYYGFLKIIDSDEAGDALKEIIC